MSIYLVLGMRTDEVATVFLYEVLMISLLSLVMGCILGNLISFAGIWVLRRGTNLDTVTNPFSLKILLETHMKTILLCAFLVICNVNINSKTIEKNSILSLKNRDKVNDSEKNGCIWIKVIVFVCAIFLIIYASTIGETLAYEGASIKLISKIIAGILGCFWFYWGFSSALEKICMGLESIYYHKYNSFIVSQLKRNVSFHYKSMAIVSLGLLISICSFTFVSFFLSNYKESLAEKSCYAATVWFSEDDGLAEDVFNIIKTDYSYCMTCCLLHRYSKEGDLPGQFSNKGFEYFVSVSDYNNAMKLQGKRGISLDANEYALCSRYGDNDENILLYDEEFMIDDVTLKPYKRKLLRSDIYNSLRGNNVIVVSDEYLKQHENEFEYQEAFIDIIYNKNVQMAGVQQLYSELKGYKDVEIIDKASVREMVKLDTYTGVEIIAFFSLGILFIFFACTILEMHSITELYDSAGNYRTLTLLGCTRKERNRIIAVHLSVIYMIPFGITGCVMIRVLRGLFENSYNMEKYIGLTVVLFSLFYISYFLVTLVKSFRMMEGYAMESYTEQINPFQ